jgi:hypothetical protein
VTLAWHVLTVHTVPEYPQSRARLTALSKGQNLFPPIQEHFKPWSLFRNSRLLREHDKKTTKCNKYWPPLARFFSVTPFYLLNIGVQGYCCIWSRSMTHTHTHSVGLVWTRGRPNAETSTWQHITFTRDRHPCHQWDLNPQSQQASGDRTTLLDHAATRIAY